MALRSWFAKLSLSLLLASAWNPPLLRADNIDLLRLTASPFDNENDRQPSATTAEAILPLDNAIAARSASTVEHSDPRSANPDEPKLDPRMDKLRFNTRRALAYYYPRHLNTRDHTPWEVMHGIISYGVDAQLFKGGPGGPEVNAIGWMCYNNPLHGEQIMYLKGDRIVARKGPGVQGHYGQFLAILAQSHVKDDYPIRVSGRMFTLRELIEHEKRDCEAGTELTFKLIALMHYLDSDETWTSYDGQTWSIQRLVHEELKQPIRGAACGGTHRLMGFSYAVNKRIKRGKPMVGEFVRAQKFIQDYHRYTLRMQNADGSFSTEWFKGPGNNPDIDRRLKTSGHILEWLCFSLTDEELAQPKMVKAAEYLSNLLLSKREHTWEIGPIGHGLHALKLYDRRVFKQLDAEEPPQAPEMAQAPKRMKDSAFDGRKPALDDSVTPDESWEPALLKDLDKKARPPKETEKKSGDANEQECNQTEANEADCADSAADPTGPRLKLSISDFEPTKPAQTAPSDAEKPSDDDGSAGPSLGPAESDTGAEVPTSLP